MSARGSSLLEVAAALAIGSLAAASAASHARSSALALDHVRRVDRALTAARNALESAVGSPCASTPPAAHCPAGLRCSIAAEEVARHSEGAATVRIVRVSAAVHADDPEPLVRMTTLARRLEPCPP